MTKSVVKLRGISMRISRYLDGDLRLEGFFCRDARRFGSTIRVWRGGGFYANGVCLDQGFTVTNAGYVQAEAEKWYDSWKEAQEISSATNTAKPATVKKPRL